MLLLLQSFNCLEYDCMQMKKNSGSTRTDCSILSKASDMVRVSSKKSKNGLASVLPALKNRAKIQSLQLRIVILGALRWQATVSIKFEISWLTHYASTNQEAFALFGQCDEGCSSHAGRRIRYVRRCNTAEMHRPAGNRQLTALKHISVIRQGT